MATLTKLQYGEYLTIEQAGHTAQIYIDYQNKRIIIHSCSGELDKFIKTTQEMCGKYGMGKLLATVREEDRMVFLDNGFVQEAIIDGYFKGITGYNVSYFYEPARALSDWIDEEDEIVAKTMGYNGQYEPSDSSIFSVRTANLEDVEALTRLYDTVFDTYPTPMNHVDYLRNLINTNKVYFKVAEFENRIVSAASADLDHELLNAEISDCATYKEFRKKGFMSDLIYHLENSLKEMNYITLFSVARAISPGINLVFRKHGYEYSGRQIKNTNIMGRLEDMNIWVKRL